MENKFRSIAEYKADQRAKLCNITSSKLKLMLGKNKILFIDEAQRIENIRLTIKLITDHIKDVQVVIIRKSSYNPIKEAVNPFSKNAHDMPSQMVYSYINNNKFINQYRRY